jgi:hypothetical protein
LQRTIGNRAVQRLLESENPDTPAADQPATSTQRATSMRQWLAQGERAVMESRFGQDFSGVRVHEDASASARAEALHAHAYTVGQDIVFGRRAVAPGSREGRHTLAHELAHVVQQRRGGGPPSPEASSRLEQAADQAATQAVDGRGMVAVAGAAGPSVMCQPEEEEESKAASRQQQKLRTQQRERERATAGVEESAQSQAEAERELRALEESYRQPGAQQRSVKRKAADLERFRRLLQRAGGTSLEKNQRQGAFDELQRTPTTTTGAPQTKYVAGGEQLPEQELRAGRERYAQPDYSIVRRRSDGSFERVHVNLKSDRIDARTPAQARATARAYVEQAIRNSRHLPTGDTIVISFAVTPSADVQEVMRSEFFRPGSPVGELRFGTTTYRAREYQAPAAPKAPTQPGGSPQSVPAPAAPKTTPPSVAPVKPSGGPSVTTTAPQAPRTVASHETIEPFSQRPPVVKAPPAGGIAVAAAGQLLADVNQALQREAVVRDARRAGSLRTYRWWLQRGIQPPARAVYDRWFTADEADTEAETIARRIRGGRFDGMEVGRISTPQQYEQFEAWVRENVRTWDDFYQHFISSEDAGVRLHDGRWEVVTWEWGDWWPANATRVVEQDERITQFMEQVRAGVLARTEQEITALPGSQSAFAPGSSTTRIAGVRKFQEGFVDHSFYTPARQIRLLVNWDFEPVFYEVTGVPVPKGYTLVSGADLRTYALIYHYRAYYDRGSRPVATISGPARFDAERAYTGWGPVNIPCILVRTDSLTSATNR